MTSRAPYLAESVEYAVEEDENRTTGHLGDVVEGLAGVVAHTGILVLKTGQNRLDQLGKVHTNGCLWQRKKEAWLILNYAEYKRKEGLSTINLATAEAIM